VHGQNEVDRMKKGADSTSKVMQIQLTDLPIVTKDNSKLSC